MKIRMLAVAVLLTFALVSVCTAKEKGQRAGKEGQGQSVACIAEMKELGLSKDQVAKIRDIVKKFHEDIKGVMQSDLPRDQKMAKAKSLRTTAGDAVMAVLTPEQQVKAKEMKFIEKLLSPRKQGMELREALQQLGLTPEQKAKTRDIMKDAATKGEAIKNDEKLSPEQRKAKSEELKKATLDAVMAVLTTEQQAKLKELLAKSNAEGAGGKGTGFGAGVGGRGTRTKGAK